MSVIVATYNRQDYIAECIDSLLAQTQPACEIIVVDDGSDDATPSILKSYGDRIRYLRQENSGKSTAVNLALSNARGDWIWLFDDDDVAVPDAIESRINVLKHNPDAGFVYSPHFIGHTNFDGTITEKTLYCPSETDSKDLLFSLLKGCFFHLNSALVRKDAYQAIGGFDTALLRGQDYDVQIRLARQYPAAYDTNPSFIFRQHTGPRGTKLNRHSGQERETMFSKFDQVIGAKIRSTLDLPEYLPHSVPVAAPCEHRYALLRRMVVMASKGRIDDMFDDLSAALKEHTSKPPFSDAEIRLIASVVYTGNASPAIYSDWTHFIRRLKSLPATPSSKQAIRAIAFGFLRFARSYPGSSREKLGRIFSGILVTLTGLRLTAPPSSP